MSNENIPRDEREYMRYLRDIHIKNQNNKCYYCRCVMDEPWKEAPRSATLEHLKGRATNYLNTAAACRKCNMDKGSKIYLNKKPVPKIKVKEMKNWWITENGITINARNGMVKR